MAHHCAAKCTAEYFHYLPMVGGQGAALAWKRRQEWSREEAMAKEERSAAWLARITGHDIVRRGMFWSA